MVAMNSLIAAGGNDLYIVYCSLSRGGVGAATEQALEFCRWDGCRCPQFSTVLNAFCIHQRAQLQTNHRHLKEFHSVCGDLFFSNACRNKVPAATE